MTRARDIMAIDGAAAPGYLLRSGFFGALIDNAQGDTSAALAQGGIDAGESVILTTPRSIIAASAMVSIGVAHTSDISKRFTTGKEAAMGGASTLVDTPFDVAILDRLAKEQGGLAVLEAGSIQFPGGVPTYLWRGGYYSGALGDLAAGDTSMALVGGGLDATQCVILVTPRGVLAASGLVSIGVSHTSDVSKRFSTMVEGAAGAASVATDAAFDYVVLGLMREHNHPLRLLGICSITAQVGPLFAVNSGMFTQIARTGAGDYNLTLAAGGVDATQAAIIACPRAAQAASQLRAVGVNHTSDTVKQITCLQEGAAGAVSALTDFNFDVAVFARAFR